MMGWLVLAVLIALSAGSLWLMKVRGGLLTAAMAALVFGAAGYAFQGKPGLPDAPADAAAERAYVPLAAARHVFYGNFSPEESWMSMSEALERSGDTENAVGLLQNAVNRYPGSAHLWIGLGNALVDHAHGLTPPAEMAYQRAAELSPGYPGPPFFYGLAMARSGDRASAVAIWQRILANSPKDANFRPLVELGIATLSQPPPAPEQAGGSTRR